MKLSLISALMLLAPLLLALPAAAQASAQSACKPPTTTLKFPPGATRATVSGPLSPRCSETFWVWRARAGQQMTVTIKGDGPTRGTVTFPSGAQDGQPGGVVFKGKLPETGLYRLRVSESPMAQPWTGQARVTVEIW
jgi:hypothetical protein